MSYTKNTWARGDVITSAKLNNMESGIEAANTNSTPTVMCIDRIVTDDLTGDVQLNKTFNEIKTAFDNGCLIFVKHADSTLDYPNISNIIYIVTEAMVWEDDGEPPLYSITTRGISDTSDFEELTCDDPDDYPGSNDGK